MSICTVQGAFYSCILAASMLKLPTQLLQCSSEIRCLDLDEYTGTLYIVPEYCCLCRLVKGW